MAMDKLKPCPFCGGEACVYSDGWGVWFGVSCKCGHHTDEFRTEQEAIEAWNKRKGDGE
jgi:Lar family restriction alleviation protein